MKNIQTQPCLPHALVEMGKAHGFVTHQEIADHFPAIADTDELFAGIVSCLNDLNIAVYEMLPEPFTMGLLVGLEEDAPVQMEEIHASRPAESRVSCEFSFVCDRRWQDLPEGPDVATRFCAGCKRTVHLCLDPDEAAESIAAKKCVALMFAHERK